MEKRAAFNHQPALDQPLQYFFRFGDSLFDERRDGDQFVTAMAQGQHGTDVGAAVLREMRALLQLSFKKERKPPLPVEKLLTENIQQHRRADRLGKLANLVAFEPMDKIVEVVRFSVRHVEKEPFQFGRPPVGRHPGR